MTEWRTARLGDLFEVDNAKLGDHDREPTVLSLSKHKGFVRADAYFEKRIASAKLDSYKVVEPNQWAFSTIHIDEGSIARNNLGVVGVISPMYTTMRWRSEADLPEYAEFLLRQPSMLRKYASLAQGSINRRRSLPFKAFASIEVQLPPEPEQRRIVDLICAVDVHIGAIQSEAETLGDLMRSAGFSSLIGAERVPLGSVARMYQPKTLAKAELDESGKYVVYGANGPIGRHSEFNHEHSQVAVTCRGATCGVVNWTPPNCWITGNAMVVQPLGDLNERYLYWALKFGSDLQSTVGGSAQPQITRTSLSPMSFPLLSVEEQKEIAILLDDMEHAQSKLLVEAKAASDMREDLVASLLSGAVQLSTDYDEFLTAGAA